MRVTGIVIGSMISPCAANSPATSSAAAALGSASSALPGVRTGLPSSRTSWPLSPTDTVACV
jgi:hypothetical protein